MSYQGKITQIRKFENCLRNYTNSHEDGNEVKVLRSFFENVEEDISFWENKNGESFLANCLKISRNGCQLFFVTGGNQLSIQNNAILYGSQPQINARTNFQLYNEFLGKLIGKCAINSSMHVYLRRIAEQFSQIQGCHQQYKEMNVVRFVLEGLIPKYKVLTIRLMERLYRKNESLLVHRAKRQNEFDDILKRSDVRFVDGDRYYKEEIFDEVQKVIRDRHGNMPIIVYCGNSGGEKQHFNYYFPIIYENKESNGEEKKILATY